MPKFEVVSIEEAMQRAGRGAGENDRYVEFVGSLSSTKAGKITPGEGETYRSVRVRLGRAAKSVGRTLTMKRVGDELYCWLADQPTGRRRGRRPRQTTDS